MEFIFGALASFIVEVIKKYAGTNRLTTYGILVAVSALAGLAYVQLYEAGYWQTVLQVGVVASAVHNLLIRRLNE